MGNISSKHGSMFMCHVLLSLILKMDEWVMDLFYRSFERRMGVFYDRDPKMKWLMLSGDLTYGIKFFNFTMPGAQTDRSDL